MIRAIATVSPELIRTVDAAIAAVNSLMTNTEFYAEAARKRTLSLAKVPYDSWVSYWRSQLHFWALANRI